MSVLDKSSRFGNRLKYKESLSSSELGILKLERGTAIYKRLSTHEQVHTSRFSLERQHRLESLAVKDGYRATLSEEDIAKTRVQADYRGFYQNGAIWVIESDLGISGTKGQEGRPGLAL